MLSKGMSGVLSLDPSSLSGVRRAFAAAPQESVLRPTIVSTIFPQLPRSSMRAFRTCLALGLAAVLILGIAKLYPVALIAGAVMLPTLVIIYMFDVNVFEDTSLSFVLGTVGWGLVTGVITALIAKAISPNGTDVFTGAHGSLVLVRGLLIPVVSAVLILVGPAALMRVPRFSTVLDGVTFAAASAATFIGAEAIIQALSALGNGLRPPGSVVPWLVQLAIIAIALPLVTIGAMAAAAGALWLKYRAPIRDRSALGRLGRPALAVPLGVVALVRGRAGPAGDRARDRTGPDGGDRGAGDAVAAPGDPRGPAGGGAGDRGRARDRLRQLRSPHAQGPVLRVLRDRAGRAAGQPQRRPARRSAARPRSRATRS